MKILIVYYSKTGHTKKVAEKLAENLNADTEEITEKGPKKGLIGWLIQAKDAWSKKSTPINNLKHQIADYDLVIIGTPVWAWSMASPIRAFMEKNKQDLKQVAFFATMTKTGDKQTFSHMEELSGLTPTATESFIDKKVKNDDFEEKLTNFIKRTGVRHQPYT